MSKKIVLFIALAMALLSIMGIVVFGTMPEAQQPSLTGIFIDDFDEEVDGEKYKDLSGYWDGDGEFTYVIHYRIEPESARQNIRARSSEDNIVVQVDEVNQHVLVRFELGKRATVTVRIRDRDTERYDEITLGFKHPDEHFDLDPFAD